jgi:AcrR family transcriptional regulator
LHRVGSKEALWNAIIERQALYLRPFIAELKDLQKRTGTSIRARVETALRQMVEATLGNPECGMLLSRIISERGANLDLLVEKLLRPYHDALSPLLQEAIQAGVIRNQQLELLYFMIINAVTMTVSHRHLLAYFEDISQNMDRLKEDMIEVLIVNFLVSQA